MSTKKPSKKEKIQVYEDFLHKINVAVVCGRPDLIQGLINNADRWSYAHRQGDCISDKEREQMINAAFWKLLD